MLARVSDRFADWLSSPVALVQGVLLVVLWVPFIAFGVDWHGFWLLAALTIGSWVTQFPLARKADRADRHVTDALRLLVALAEEIKAGQDQQDHLLEEIAEDIEGLS